MVLHQCTKKYDLIMYSCRVTAWNGRKDRRMGGKSDFRRWMPHLKSIFYNTHGRKRKKGKGKLG